MSAFTKKITKEIFFRGVFFNSLSFVLLLWRWLGAKRLSVRGTKKNVAKNVFLRFEVLGRASICYLLSPLSIFIVYCVSR
jgi:hypothetical protein